ncbi:MAG: hypothetical protein EB107_07000, partial [Proteobacteria bacterium]|nr:hypothetical protein [Pseudomonadota bacterium]
MPRTIRITAGNVTMDATLNETATASEIWDALPITARANIWGDEIYFAIPVHRDEENAKATVGLGDLGYWPPGNAFCIFYGPTPMSRGDEIRPASPVNRSSSPAWSSPRPVRRHRAGVRLSVGPIRRPDSRTSAHRLVPRSRMPMCRVNRLQILYVPLRLRLRLLKKRMCLGLLRLLTIRFI